MAPDLETLQHKLDVLREHCRTVGRDYDSIEKTTSLTSDPNDVGATVERTRRLADMGIQTVFIRAASERPLELIERIAQQLLPRLAAV
jgi:hypothetical protein